MFKLEYWIPLDFSDIVKVNKLCFLLELELFLPPSGQNKQ